MNSLNERLSVMMARSWLNSSGREERRLKGSSKKRRSLPRWLIEEGIEVMSLEERLSMRMSRVLPMKLLILPQSLLLVINTSVYNKIGMKN